MKKNNEKNVRELGFSDQDREMYDALLELGLVTPKSEEDVKRIDRVLAKFEQETFPDELASPAGVIQRIRHRLSEEEGEIHDDPPKSNIKPFLGYVSDKTGLTPSKIEQHVGYTTEFLIQITENPQVVRDPVREEVARATILEFPELDRAELMVSLRQSSTRVAAARDDEYKDQEISFEKILKSSGMSKKKCEQLLALNEVRK